MKGLKLIDSPAKALVALLVLLIILEGSYSGIKVLSGFGGGYITAYEGAKARYAGVQSGTATSTQGTFDTTLGYDPDARGEGKPAVAGEMTAVFVPSESVGKQTRTFGSGFDIGDWLLSASTVKNPAEVYEWNMTEANTTTVYRMEEWALKWYFSISAEPVGNEILKCYLNEMRNRNSHTDLKVWFQFDIAPVWYFEGTTTAYFAIAELRVCEIALGGQLKDGTYEGDVNTELRVAPMSKGSILLIYYGLFGAEANRAEKTAYSYKGKRLNPDLFTDTVYSYINLADFGVSSWYDWGSTAYRSDVVTVGVDFTVFVVGEWKVKDVQDIPDEYGRSAKEGGFGFAYYLAQLMNDPSFRILLVLIGAVIFFLILAVLAPAVLISIFALVSSGKKRKGG